VTFCGCSARRHVVSVSPVVPSTTAIVTPGFTYLLFSPTLKPFTLYQHSPPPRFHSYLCIPSLAPPLFSSNSFVPVFPTPPPGRWGGGVGKTGTAFMPPASSVCWRGQGRNTRGCARCRVSRLRHFPHVSCLLRETGSGTGNRTGNRPATSHFTRVKPFHLARPTSGRKAGRVHSACGRAIGRTSTVSGVGDGSPFTTSAERRRFVAGEKPKPPSLAPREGR
jgi:hypothetical protein